MKYLPLLATALALSACVDVSQTNEPGRPITYSVPDYRNNRSVGNLRRLAVLPFAFELRHGDLEQARAYAATASSLLAEYLENDKGYAVVAVHATGGGWTADSVHDPALGSALQTTWDAARTDAQRADAVRRIGRALDVDGVVSGWLEYDSRTLPGGEGLGVTFALMNILLLNGPLFYEMSHDRVRIHIYETASGRTLWKVAASNPTGPPGVASLLGNLENAIPAQLVR